MSEAEVKAQSPHSSDLQQRRADGLWEGTANIGGLYCGACAYDIQSEALKTPGIYSFEVNPASGLGHWVASNQLAINEFGKRIEKLGYRFLSSNITPRELSQQQHKKELRQHMLRWSVGLLCAVQIMMYAGPEYFYSVADLGVQSVHILRWAQWVLVLPVMLYCAQPLFVRAFRAALQKKWAVEQPVVLGILLAFVFSSSQLLSAQGHVWFDSIAMLVTFLALSRWLVERFSRKAVYEVLSMAPDLPEQVERLINDQWQLSLVSQLQQGDTFRLSQGMSCPVDAQLADSKAVAWFDESLLTGESTPVKKNGLQCIDAGSRFIGESIKLIVVSSTVGNYLQHLSGLLSRAMAQKPLWQSHLDRLLPWFVAMVFCLALGRGLYSYYSGDAASQLIQLVVTMLLVACPCALALSWPLVRLFVMVRFQQDGLLVAQPAALERLSKVTAITYDKTGTLAPVGQASVQWSYYEMTDTKNDWSAQLIHEVTLMMATHSSHPLARALLKNELPEISAAFSNRFEFKSVLEITGMGISAVVQDTTNHNTMLLRLGSAKFCGAQSELTEKSVSFLSVYPSFNVACLTPSSPAVVLACVQVNWGDSILDKTTLNTLSQLGLKQFLISGDHQKAVIGWMPALTFDGRYWQQTAEQKAQVIQRLQQQGHVVTMIGDGLNDAVAFAQADVAIACKNATALSAQQADILVPQSALAQLPTYITLCRQANRIGFQNMYGSMAYNLSAMALAATGLINPLFAAVGMGLSSIVVFLNAARLTRCKSVG